MALPNRSHMTVEEYFDLDERDFNVRYEYIDGHIRMLSGGTPDHAKIAANLILAIGNQLSESCSVYTSDVRVQLAKDRYVRPDVSVSCDTRDQNQEKVIQHPYLVVEVLSPSTESYDRSKKLLYYQACPSIQEYVLINADFQWVEVFRRSSNNLWIHHAFELDDEIELTSIGCCFPIAKVYRNVNAGPLPEPPEA